MLGAFVSGLCKDGYVTYDDNDFQICLKYVPDPVRYTQARAHCEEEGGDLIRIDTTLKYDIFKEMLSKNPRDCDYLPQIASSVFSYSYTEIEMLSYYTCIKIDQYLSVFYLYFPLREKNNLILYLFTFLPLFAIIAGIDVWIQAIKVGQDWKFHDGSPLTGAFPIRMSNGSNEIHLRCRSELNFECFDIPETRERHYMLNTTVSLYSGYRMFREYELHKRYLQFLVYST